MFPHPWGFVGDMYKVSCEVIALQHKKKKNGTKPSKIWKYDGKSIFFLSIDQNTPQKKLEEKYGLS